eukprot:1089001-Rhodomonas_salina.1
MPRHQEVQRSRGWNGMRLAVSPKGHAALLCEKHEVSPARSDAESVSRKTQGEAQPKTTLKVKESPLAGAKNVGGLTTVN